LRFVRRPSAASVPPARILRSAACRSARPELHIMIGAANRIPGSLPIRTGSHARVLTRQSRMLALYIGADSRASELRVAVSAFLERFPDYRLASDRIVYMDRTASRRPTRCRCSRAEKAGLFNSPCAHSPPKRFAKLPLEHFAAALRGNASGKSTDRDVCSGEPVRHQSIAFGGQGRALAPDHACLTVSPHWVRTPMTATSSRSGCSASTLDFAG